MQLPSVSQIKTARRGKVAVQKDQSSLAGSGGQSRAAGKRETSWEGSAMLELVIPQRQRSLGGFDVGRLLPWSKRRMVGPFIFFDRMGPLELPAGSPESVDVLPHPHIGLSTITYLFAGEIMHRDSLASEQPIRPGEVNWMTAGRDHHSERFERARRGDPSTASGLGRPSGRGGGRNLPSPTRARTCRLSRRRDFAGG